MKIGLVGNELTQLQQRGYEFKSHCGCDDLFGVYVCVL